MGYAEAIEQQAATLRYWWQRESLDHAAWWMAGRDERHAMHEARDHGREYTMSDDLLASAREMRQGLIASLGRATPVFVAAPVCEFILNAAISLGDAGVLLPELLPVPAAFVWFEQAIPFDAGPHSVMQALHWDIDTDGGGLGTIVFDLRQGPWGVCPQPSLIWAWKFGNRAMDDADYPVQGSRKQSDHLGQPLREHAILFSLLRFLNQRILTVSPRDVTNRGARKRLARQFEHIPEVRIVQLRAREYQQRDESEGRDVEYSCQWLVRGHWHKYHTREGLQPRWVMPYVKGPSDKPLRIAEKVAYEVVR